MYQKSELRVDVSTRVPVSADSEAPQIHRWKGVRRRGAARPGSIN